jgi:hypothetical protein
MYEAAQILRRIRCALLLFIAGLVISGLTAFPLRFELDQIAAFRNIEHVTPADAGSGFDRWILTVRDGLRRSYADYPWLAYGTDWLAFGHIAIAVFFIGALIDPLRNIWVLRAGLITCALVVPLALICGQLRQIPFGWRLIDCSFGVFGAIPLLYSLRLTKALGGAKTTILKQ